MGRRDPPNLHDPSEDPPAVRSPPPRSNGGRSFSSPDLPTFSVWGKWFPAPYPRRVSNAGVVQSPPPQYHLLAKAVRGTRLPPSRYRLPLASCLHHPDVAPSPAPAPCGPPRNPASLSTRHRALTPWPTPQ